MKTIRGIFQMVEVVPSKLYTSEKALANPDPALIYGIELEIENAQMLTYPRLFNRVIDGSLRNDGMEFISRPAYYSTLVRGLEQFFKSNPGLITVMDSDGTYAPNSNYSERTSIHVHTNCQDLTTDQMASICLLYQTFERVLFHFIRGDRDKNIFCVPWCESLISQRTIRSFLNGQVDKIYDWQKYTALNLLPLSSKGTIEWRHMAGTNDVTYIKTWLTIIGHFFRCVRAHPFDYWLNQIITLNSTSQYERVLNEIFPDIREFNYAGYKQHIAEGVLDVKYDWLD